MSINPATRYETSDLIGICMTRNRNHQISEKSVTWTCKNSPIHVAKVKTVERLESGNLVLDTLQVIVANSVDPRKHVSVQEE